MPPWVPAKEECFCLLLTVLICCVQPTGGPEAEDANMERSLIVACIVYFCLNAALFPLRRAQNSPLPTITHTCGFHLVFTLFCLVAYFVVWHFQGANPGLWILYTTWLYDGHLWALYWIACLVVSVVILQRGGQRLPKIVIRKYYHFLACIMFLPCIRNAPEFMGLAFSVSLVLLTVAEVSRRHNIPPLGPPIHNFMCQFVDDRDHPQLYLTHVFLLLGCASPLWLANRLRLHPSPAATLLPYSGVVILGVGDSFASICGVFAGRTKWKRIMGSWWGEQKKTVEGTIGGILATILLAVALIVPKGSWGWYYWFVGLLLPTILTMFFEACTTTLDNATLPLIFAFLLFVSHLAL
eukprot:TRINITY_DN66706_c0_g1_i2.p1 TRINITY_DN66706_c0_g1~~TRINITY_DN66706_c0_g1_i2.p1  ORF type:complete len:353 (+),score=9.77 TRINITY_DN66706_c0_g1_i2:62-1120(+)